MKEIDARLEALMGKLLDGEITAAEQRRLDDALRRDPEAGERLAQMHLLADCSREAVTAEIAKHSRGPEDILQDTALRSRSAKWPRIFRLNGRLPFAAGMAAGFLLGLLMHFALIRGQSDVAPPAGSASTPVVRGVSENDLLGDDTVSGPAADRYHPMIRNVDWYKFTDSAGRQWLIQGVREGTVHPAVYNGDLY